MTETARIPLRYRDGSVREWAIIDLEDYDKMSEWRWHLCLSKTNSYARRFRYGGGKQYPVMMHRVLLGLDDWDGTNEVDHKDGDGLNNRRSNLIISSRALNARNRRKIAGASSKYRGVYYDKRIKRWGAHVKLNGKRTYFGFYETEEEANIAAVAGRAMLFG